MEKGARRRGEHLHARGLRRVAGSTFSFSSVPFWSRTSRPCRSCSIECSDDASAGSRPAYSSLSAAAAAAAAAAVAAAEERAAEAAEEGAATVHPLSRADTLALAAATPAAPALALDSPAAMMELSRFEYSIISFGRRTRSSISSVAFAMSGARALRNSLRISSTARSIGSQIELSSDVRSSPPAARTALRSKSKKNFERRRSRSRALW